MHSFSRSLLGLGALTLAGCGAPAELDESRFPGVNDTGYKDGFSPIGGAGTGALASNAGAPGASGSGNVPSGGSGSVVGQGGSAPVAAGGNGSVSAGGSAPVGQGGSSSGGGGEPTGNGSCPDDITVLFARPVAQGGCDGAACHSPMKQTPDLVSPGVEARLLDVPSRCMSIPYISAGESFLEEKLEGDPRCGFAMPFGGSMTPEDKQCVLEWIDEVSGG
jgi:hypothetical protein